MNKIILGAMWPLFISLYKSSGREGVKRAITIPEKELKRVQSRNQDSLDEAIQKRDAFVEAAADFVEELANLDDD